MSTRCRWTRSPSTLSRMLVKELDPHSVYIPASEMQASERTSRRGVRRHRRGLQHGHRHGDRAERHSAGPERQGRASRPATASSRSTIRWSPGRQIPQRDVVKTLRGTARHDGAPRARTAGHRRPGGGRRSCATRFRSGASNRPSASPTASVTSSWGSSPGPPSTRCRKALASLRAQGVYETDLRPAGQFGRVPRPGDRRRQRVPAQGPADRLHRRPPSRAAARIRRRHGRGAGHGCRGADRRGKRLVERNPRRSVAGQRPWYDCWTPFVRQGTRPASDPVQRRIGPAADHGALLHAYGPFDPETLYDRRRRELRGGHLEPVPEQRVLLGRQHPLRRFAANGRRRAGRWSTAAAASCPTSSCRPIRPT